MAASQQDSSNEQNTTADTDRNTIHQILSEFGLDPSDYIFNLSNEETANHLSAFTKYTPQPQTSTISGRPLSYVQQSPPQPQTSTTSGRPLSYIQQPPPPSIINHQASTSQSLNDMAQQTISPRRTPPPPPTLPPSSSVRPLDLNINDSNLSAEQYLRQIDSQDNPPVKVVKPNTQNVVYRKEIRIRYLQPPTPPPPAPIIIRERHVPPNPPESPLLIRERKPEARTPPPLTIRERPPTPPPPLEPYIIEKPLPPPPPQPRQIIIERLPTPPPKPRTVIFEKWLPYKKVKRPILLQKATPIPPVKPTRNVIIEYEPLKAYTVRRVIEEGVFRVDPTKYTNYTSDPADGDVRIVDRIEDLPPPSEELLRVLQSYNQPNSVNFDQLTNVTHSSGTPTHRQEHLVTSSNPSPVPLKTEDIY